MSIELFAVLNDFLGSYDFRYFDQLIVVVRALKEGLLLEHHSSKHASR